MVASFVILIALAAISLLGFGLVALIAVVTKRPAIAVLGGLMVLLLMGGVLTSLVVPRVMSRSQVHYKVNGMSVRGPTPAPPAPNMPAIPVVPAAPAAPDLSAMEHGGSTVTTTWKFGIVTLLLLPMLVVALIVAGIVKLCRINGEKQHAGHGARWWPALAIVGILAIPLLLLFGMFGTYQSRHVSNTVIGNETVVQDFGSFEVPQQASDVAHAHAEAVHQMRTAQMAAAEAQRAQAAQLADAYQEVTSTYRDAQRGNSAKAGRDAAACMADLQSQLQRYFANVDINVLIDQFNKPKVILPPASLTAEMKVISAPHVVAVAPGNGTLPVVTTAVVTATAEATAEKVKAAEKSEPAAKQSGKAIAATKPGDASVADNTKPSGESAPVKKRSRKKTVAKQANDKTVAAGGEKVSGHKDAKPAEPPRAEAVAVKAEPLPNHTAKALPDWADDEPRTYMPDSWREVIVTDEYATPEECRRATDVYLLMKTAERIRSLEQQSFFETSRPSLTFHQGMIMADGVIIFDSRSPYHSQDDRLQLINRLGIGLDRVRRETVREQHLASRESQRSMGTMYKQYTLVEFTKQFDDELRRAWNTYRRQERFAVVGVGAGSVLVLLASVLGLLKIDTWTKGYYTKRLFIGVPAAIIGGTVMLTVLASMM